VVAIDLRPAAIVEGESFKWLLSYLEPGNLIWNYLEQVHMMGVVRCKFAVVKNILQGILSVNEWKHAINTIWTGFSTLQFIINS